MARRPKQMPPWVDHVYRGDEQAWEDAKRECRTMLYAGAAAGRPVEYQALTKELERRVPALRWDHGPGTDYGSQLGYLLGQVAMEELQPDEDRPVISALAVGSDNKPGTGFWDLCSGLGLSIGGSEAARYEFWVKEMNASIAFYSRRRP